MRFRSSCALKGTALGREAENIEELAEHRVVFPESAPKGLGRRGGWEKA